MSRVRWFALAVVLGAAACGDDPGDDAAATTTAVDTTAVAPTVGGDSAPTTDTSAVGEPALSEAIPALADWDGRRYDVGVARNARPSGAGYVVDWDRYGLTTLDRDGELRDPDAFSSDVVEPWDSVANLSDSPFTNTNEQVRALTVTDAAWVYAVVEEALRCPGDDREDDPFPQPPWEEVALDAWVDGLGEDGDLVLLTYDARGRVVQVRPVAGC